MTAEIVAALDQLERRYEPAQWHMPLEATRHRRQLKELLESAGNPRYTDGFSYAEAPVQEYLNELRGIRSLASEVDQADLRGLLELQIERLSGKAESSLGGDDEFSAVCRNLDGLPSPELVTDAYRVLGEQQLLDSELETKTLSADDLAQRIRYALDAYHLHEWTITIDRNMAANMSVNGSLRRLRIRADACFSRRGANRLVVHEVGGHVLRWENSRRQPEPLACVSLGRTVATEEGLALVQEARADLLDQAILRTYAARTLAVHLAQEFGIADVARRIAPHVGDDAAVTIALRVKRGLRNPENLGGTTKDFGYLEGVRALVFADPDLISLLQSTKWSMDYIDVMHTLREANRLTPPVVVPDAGRLLGATSGR